ncbi:hypothetical protein LCGC14_1391650 [marine sediment metagenome]|uniref:UDP-N-acetylglucosamine 2-epimerase domain-containing protein n=1 Tax=marine sediment metagenome TaxID=412755 RepID=A0A0F9N1E4_9ZZZZ
MKKILLLSHDTQRDSATHGAIRKHLEDMGHLTWMLHFTQARRACYMKPDIVVYPEIRLEKLRDEAAQLHKNGITVAVRRCEPGMSADSLVSVGDAYKRAILGNVDYSDFVALEMVWSQEFADTLVEYKPELKGRVKAVGSFGFDTYKDRSRAKNEKPVVLLATGFPYADRKALFSIPEARVSDSLLHARLVQIDRMNRQTWFDSIKSFCEKYKDRYDIALRLHNGEAGGPYCDLIGDTVPLATGNTDAVLRAVDVLIHAGSTMAMEAHLLGIPAINFANKTQDKLVADISPNCETFESLCETFEGLELGKSNADPDVVEKLQSFYGVNDGNTCKRAAELIDALPLSGAEISGDWLVYDKIKYPSPYVYTDMVMAHCSSCNRNVAFSSGLDMVKCPYCGVCLCGLVQRMPETG